jgi:hypothetical protein
LHKAQPHALSFLPDASNESRSEVLNKAFAGPQREHSVELFEVELLDGAENGFRVLHEQSDSFAKFERTGGGNEVASGPDQQRIAHRLTQSRQRTAHR